MYILITILHALFCIALIAIVLLQTGKGTDLASAFGGGGQNAVFGGRGPASFLNKMTTVVAVLFMATSISLAYMTSGRSGSVMDGMDEPAIEETVGQETATDQPADSGNAAGEADQTGAASDTAAGASDNAVPPVTGDSADTASETDTSSSE